MECERPSGHDGPTCRSGSKVPTCRYVKRSRGRADRARRARTAHAQNSWHGRDSLSHSRHTSATVHQQQIILPISATFWPEAGRGACGAVRRGFVGSWRGERGSKGACEGQLGAVRGSCQLWAPAIVRIPDSASGLLEFLSDHQERVSGVVGGGLKKG